MCRCTDVTKEVGLWGFFVVLVLFLFQISDLSHWNGVCVSSRSLHRPPLSTSSSSRCDFNQTLSWSDKLVSVFISQRNMTAKRPGAATGPVALHPSVSCSALSVNAVAGTFFRLPETNLAIDCSEALISKD